MRGCKLNKEELLQLVKDFYTKNGRSPKLKEIRQVNGFPNIKVYYRVFETTTWNDILGLAELPIHRTTKDVHTKESLKELLIEYYNKYNKVPTITELGTKNKLPSGVVFYDRFNTQSWNEILEECVLPLNHYQGYTPEIAIEKLKEYYNTYKIMPSSDEWKKQKLIPNYDYYSQNFGSFEKAWDFAGLPFIPLTNKGRLCKDLNQELCRSIKEMQITNFLIFNKIKYTKEPLYRDLMPELTDNRRFDWSVEINNNIFYIEYLGLYKHGIKSIENAYVEKTHKKINDLKKYGHWNNAFFIYSDDLVKFSISELFNNKFNTNFKEYIRDVS